MSKIVISLILFFHFFTTQTFGQDHFAAANFDEVNEFVKHQIVNDYFTNKRIENFKDTIGIQCMSFFRNELEWVLQRINGGCLNAEEARIHENYIKYIETEILDTLFTTSIEFFDEKVLKYSKEFTKNLLDRHARFKDLKNVFESSN